MRSPASAAILVILTLAPAAAAAQDSRSSAPAKELVTSLAAHKLSAIAAKDPQNPGRYIAALCFPGVQLLVVSAFSPNAPALDAALARKDYGAVYAALQTADIREGKVFFQDIGADGLHSGTEGAVDVMYERVTDQTVFGKTPGRRKTSDAAYLQKFTAADALYARLLEVLVGETASTSGQTQ